MTTSKPRGAAKAAPAKAPTEPLAPLPPAPPPVKCLDFLKRKRRVAPPGMIATFGDDDFLRRQAREAAIDWIVGPDGRDFALSTFVGDGALFATVFDELSTRPFVGERRLVIVESAEKFVAENRARLEKYVRAPSRVGVLLLEARSWVATTNLAKLAPPAIDCGAPKGHYVAGWVSHWATLRHGKTLDPDDAAWLVELVGTNLGVLDQEARLVVGQVLRCWLGHRDGNPVGEGVIPRSLAGRASGTAGGSGMAAGGR